MTELKKACFFVYKRSYPFPVPNFSLKRNTSFPRMEAERSCSSGAHPLRIIAALREVSDGEVIQASQGPGSHPQPPVKCGKRRLRSLEAMEKRRKNKNRMKLKKRRFKREQNRARVLRQENI
jgi:hypothetical protein